MQDIPDDQEHPNLGLVHSQISLVLEKIRQNNFDMSDVLHRLGELMSTVLEPLTAIFAEQRNLLKFNIFSDKQLKIFDQHRIKNVTRFIKSSELSPQSQDAFMHRYHVLSEAYRIANKADKKSDNRTTTRKRRLQKHRTQQVHSIAYWDTSDSVILRRRLDCVYVLAISEINVATAFFAAYDTFARKNIDYRRHTLVSARTVVEQLVRATGKGIDTAEMEKKLVESVVAKRKYTHKKTKKTVREKAIPLYHCYSDPQFGQATADELGEFVRQLNKLHDDNIDLNDDEIATLLQRMEIFICDMFAYWYTLRQMNLSHITPTC